MTAALHIDHPLVVVNDIETTAASFRALGFNTAPTGYHPWGTSTSLVMFPRSAIEIMSIHDTSLLDSHAIGSFAFGRHMAQALSEREGITLAALYSEDAVADRRRLEANGLTCQGRVDFRRRVRIPGHDWDEAVVSLEIFYDPALPRASNFLCQQHRPELIWVPQWMQHPNGATGFASHTYAAVDPDRLADRFRQIFGNAATHRTDTGYRIETGRGHIHIRPPGQWSREIGLPDEPTIAPADAACIAMEVIVPDLSLLRDLLDSNGVTYVEEAGGISITGFAPYGNTIIRFVRPPGQ
ncbi:hypothetical protein KOEU_24080 [Komagataeibacter europaeus]|uniref:Glyoxalase-like domain-containing protein n=1 Tax=Komagataeibacter europaeus TaxID=33995 RepID=A0A0M0EFL6_KOMEU|nr:VOC family protein [Komagataeibacter europaeus]KON64057.1 hypothetical protein KOEU_24080 [Komagataeibacter europaeus]